MGLNNVETTGDVVIVLTEYILLRTINAENKKTLIDLLGSNYAISY